MRHTPSTGRRLLALRPAATAPTFFRHHCISWLLISRPAEVEEGDNHHERAGRRRIALRWLSANRRFPRQGKHRPKSAASSHDKSAAGRRLGRASSEVNRRGQASVRLARGRRLQIVVRGRAAMPDEPEKGNTKSSAQQMYAWRRSTTSHEDVVGINQRRHCAPAWSTSVALESTAGNGRLACATGATLSAAVWATRRWYRLLTCLRDEAGVERRCQPDASTLRPVSDGIPFAHGLFRDDRTPLLTC